MSLAEKVIDNTYTKKVSKSENNKTEKDFVWDEFIECVKVLQTLDKEDVKDYLKTHCNDDVEMIIEEYHKAFKDVPNDSILRFETLRLLAIMGIEINKETTDIEGRN